MKLITFSLWGQDPKYLVGALKNAELAQEIYPGWTCRYYIGTSVPFSIAYQLEAMSNVQVVRKPDFGDWRGMFWRFEPASEDDVEVMISRDTDSRLNIRERHAVDEWINSNYGFHIMKDHPWHYTYPILAGMCGMKSGTICDMRKKIDNWEKINSYHCDQEFLKKIIYPDIADNCLLHDSFKDQGRRFPTPRQGLGFVGQVFDESDETVREHLDVMRVENHDNR